MRGLRWCLGGLLALALLWVGLFAALFQVEERASWMEEGEPWRYPWPRPWLHSDPLPAHALVWRPLVMLWSGTWAAGR